MSILIIALAGILVAFCSVFLGLGGGILLVPLLPSFFGLSVHQAVATSLTTIFMVVSVNTLMFHRAKLVEWRLVALMAPPCVITAFLAARYSSQVDPRWILMVVAMMLAFIAVRTLIMSMQSLEYEVPETIPVEKKVISVVGGGVAGVAAGFAGVGGGAILSQLMIVLKLIQPAKLSPTSNANVVFATGAAALSLFVSGEFVSWRQWGNIRLDLALGIFLTATLLTHFLRPYQHKLPFIAKALLLNFLLLFLISKVVYMLFL